ncbi:MAG: hypothetical protein GQ574_25005 [Crocinitomix sp.]|nr:hypothetical protein [Crocinitomix sp.]
MKALKLLILSTLLTFVGQVTYAQNNNMGEVRFLVNVDNSYFEIEINDTMLLKRYKDSLPAGDYSAKVWSPGYIMNRIEFTVVAGKMTEKRVDMVKNNNFNEYERDYKKYRMQFHKQLTAPLALTLTSAVTSGVFMVNAYNYKKKVIADIEDYHLSPVTSEIGEIKLRIAENNKKYNFHRSAFYINSGFTFLFVGGTIWSYMNFKKNNIEPDYSKDSPFKDKFSLNLTPYGCSLAIKL